MDADIATTGCVMEGWRPSNSQFVRVISAGEFLGSERASGTRQLSSDLTNFLVGLDCDSDLSLDPCHNQGSFVYEKEMSLSWNYHHAASEVGEWQGNPINAL